MQMTVEMVIEAAKDACWRIGGGDSLPGYVKLLSQEMQEVFTQAWNERAEELATEGRR